MEGKEKNDYVVYKHICPDGMVYVGMTKDIKSRWNKTHYNHKPFVDWINQYGWDNIIHEVVFDNLYKEEAALIEDNLIGIYSSVGKSLNNYESGYKGFYGRRMYGLANDCLKMMKRFRKEYKKELKKDINIRQRDYRIEYYNKFRSTVEGKIYNRVAAYNQWLTKYGRNNEIIETPAEARKKYLDSGYIPNYIKNDDLM